MATIQDRYWNSGGSVKKTFRVTFINRVGRRQTASFQDEDAATFFWREVVKKEQKWKAECLLGKLESGGNE